MKEQPSRYGSVRWRDQRGNTWRIEDMATSHLKNCLPFMRRNARNLVHTDADGWWNFAMYLQGEMAIDATESNAMQAERMAEEGSDAECVRWVRESGAYRAMVNELWERRCLLRSGIQRLDLVPK